jgi:hypothetical protein
MMGELAVQIEEAVEKLAPGNEELQFRLKAAIEECFADFWRTDALHSHMRHTMAGIAWNMSGDRFERTRT